MRSLLIAFAIAGVAPAAAAQDVYKYTSPGGGTVYTDDPAAAASGARKVDLPATPPSSAGSPPGLSEAERRLAVQADQRAAALDRASSDIVAAHAQLRAAEARREQGVEPVEGERQGRRYRPEYWERQRELQRDIDVARAKLNDALERRNALR